MYSYIYGIQLSEARKYINIGSSFNKEYIDT